MKKIALFLIAFIPLIAQEIKIDAPKVISKEWEAKNLGIKYQCPDLDGAVEEFVEGIIDDTFDKAFLQRIRAEMEKNPSGEFIEYWPNGQIKARLPYQNKKPHGHLHAWYDNGRDAFKGHFNNGIKQAAHMTFLPSSWHVHGKRARLINYNLDGKLHRTQRIMDKQNSLAFAIEYQSGDVNGVIEAWDKNNKYLDCWYVNGEQRNDIPKKQRLPDMSSPLYTKYVNEIGSKFMKSAAKEFNLRPSGGGGSMPYDVETISCSFKSFQKVDKNGARKLLFALKEKLAEAVNAHENIRPYLREYPFTPARSDITISFYDKNYKNYKDGSITGISVTIYKEVLYYYYDPENPEKEIISKEPYAEAEAIVHGERK